MTYVQGFLTPLQAARRDAFVDHARKAAAIFRELGCDRTVDAWGDDVPKGKLNDFQGAVALQDGEEVGFGWMEFADKAAGDAFYAKMMSDPRMGQMGGDMPFDGKRMVLGGFETVFDERNGAARAGYVDGFVLAVPSEKKQAYVDSAAKAWPVFRDNGILRHVEAWGVDVPRGEVTDFYRAALAKEGETIVFSWFEWPDKATRDAGNAAAMADDRLKTAMDDNPIDGARMIYGGFAVVNDG